MDPLSINSDDPLDAARAEFLLELDESSLNISDWEYSFLDYMLQRTTFTDKMRDAIDRMRQKYNDKL